MSWQPDSAVVACPLCSRGFHLLFRRHHCRRCGRVVCGECSLSCAVYDPPVLSPREEQYTAPPWRTCDSCVDELANDRTQARSDPIEMPRRKDDDNASENDRCPVCGKVLVGWDDHDRELHVSDCLVQAEFSGSPEQHRSNRMLVYQMPTDTQVVVSCSDASNVTANCEKIGPEECVICLEDLNPGDKVGRLECLCVYHYKCIKSWFKQRGPGCCPVHAVGS